MGGTLTIRHGFSDVLLVLLRRGTQWADEGRVGHVVGFSGNGCVVSLSVGCLRTA